MNIYQCRLNIRRFIKLLLCLSSMIFVVTSVGLCVFYHSRWRNLEDVPTALERPVAIMDMILDPFEKIDWHDDEFIRVENSRVGNGEHGEPAVLPSYHNKNMCDPEEVLKNLGYDGCLSDHISVSRSLPDTRPAGCRYVNYYRHLPKVTVIMPAHNEHWSVLLRAIYSIVNRSPENLLKEIILVDDGSSHVHMKQPLDDYVTSYLPKVRVFHIPFPPQGLMKARLLGADKATGEVLVFVDSNIEANINWLPPLLDPIVEDYRRCVCPVVDDIDPVKFQVNSVGQGFRNGFDWTLLWRTFPLLEEARKHPTKPFKDPVMIGCAFAITKRFFWELGGFDPGLQLWGGEQYELSFKIWQCGGALLNAPCSRIGHIYRTHGQPIETPVEGDFLGKNFKRIAEVWMDEYAELVSKFRGPLYSSLDPGDLSERRQLRETLKCKPFKWYMKEIAFDVLARYPPDQPPDYGSGKISSILDKQLCLKASKDIRQVKLERCFSENDYDDKQDFLLSWHKDIRLRGHRDCLQVSKNVPFASVTIHKCHEKLGNQLWKYNLETQQLWFGPYGDRCLACAVRTKQVFVQKCDKMSRSQKWKIESVNEDALRRWRETVPRIT